jgi:hypothetical protein
MASPKIALIFGIISMLILSIFNSDELQAEQSFLSSTLFA